MKPLTSSENNKKLKETSAWKNAKDKEKNKNDKEKNENARELMKLS